ncbi:MAG: sulfate adenylyltransferase subunit CysN [Rhodospirillales bacterium]|nr:sulfate adenylyltransferase subunit CysN [Rhodospirillales bacterium]
MFKLADEPSAVETFPAAQDAKDQLRFITCGSVDDGKSTLLGRLLYESKSVFEDQLAATEVESRAFGTQGEQIDLALLVDGLQAEREQGITIDVAYRYFETDKRKFIAADTPGHEQYTRNMATGASTADLAVILVDARKGVLTQTRRHSYIISLLGIRHVILAVNKMDLVDYSQSTFNAIDEDYRVFAAGLEIEQIHSVPLSALTGANVFEKSEVMPWYGGAALMELLETLQVARSNADDAFRLPVQWVNRPNLDFRGFSGNIASGKLKVGDKIVSALSGKGSTVKTILGPSGALDVAQTGQAVTVELADEIDVSRGDMLCGSADGAEVADQFAAHVVWMSDEPMIPERPYVLRFAADEANGQITDLSHVVDVNTLDQRAGKQLELNEVGYCKLALDKVVAFNRYGDNRTTGGFILIDRFTNATVGAGLIDYPLRRATNVHWQAIEINKDAHARQKNQRPAALWFTGLSGSGKSTIANAVEKRLHALGKHTFTLDGDNVRHGLNRDLGFTDADRVENIRRIAETTKLFVQSGLIVLVSFISPFRSERRMARELLEPGEFLEVFVDTPLEICEQRDVKGLYAKARRGDLPNFTGIDSPYERPETAEITVDGGKGTPDDLADAIIAELEKRGMLRNGN